MNEIKDTEIKNVIATKEYTEIDGKRYPKSYLSDEKRAEILSEYGLHMMCIMESGAADKAGDNEAGWAWLAATQLDPVNLRLIKRWHGADFIRKWGFDTTLADQEMGEGWLDKPLEY